MPVIIAVIMLFSFFGCNSNPGDSEYNKALKLWKQGHLVRARASMEKAINKHAGSPQNAVAYNQLGLILWALNEPQKAQQAFNDSRKLDPNRFDACYNLGSVLSWGGQFAEAQQILTEAALLRPNDGRALEILTVAQVAEKNWNDAEINLNNALAQNPNSARLEMTRALIELHSNAGEHNVLRTLKGIRDANPEYAPVAFNMGMIYYHWLNDGKNAEKLFEEFLQLSPSGEMADLAGDTIKEIRAGRFPDTSIAANTPLANSHSVLRFNRPEKPNRKAAQEAFSVAFKHHSDTNFDQAIKDYIKVIEFDDTYADAFYNLGLCFGSVQQLDKACAAYSESLKLNPGNQNARYGLAYTYYQLGRKDDALREVEIILSAEPTNSNAVNLKALLRS